MKPVVASLVWGSVSLAGAWAYFVLAAHRGESINSIYILIAALCTYAIGYRFYSRWIAARVLALEDRRATPCEVRDDGKDFVRTNRWIVFGHHFAAISGPGPLVGPVLAAQFGYLPGTLWILIGVVLGGAVQDFVILFCSLRRNGKSLGQMVKEELNSVAGFVALIAILAIIVILLAVLALVVVKALAESPWGVFTVGATIPIALFMGSYLRFVRVGKVLEASLIGVVLLLLAVWGGKWVYETPAWSAFFTLHAEPLAWSVILYGLAASVLPVWLLLAPRDYLSTFMKLGTIFALTAGVFLVLPHLKMPAMSRFVDGSGLVLAGKVFPFCFITIACGAISGFHTLIASGTTPKMITRERYARSIGYGAMCLESLVAIMAMVAACTLEPGVYLSMNVKAPGATPEAVATNTVAQVQTAGFAVSVEEMDQLASQIGEKTLFGRTGGAATLAVGMAQIFSRAVSGRWLDLWYHFAIMFEALFILTTLDAGTRVGRYLLQDMLGGLWKPLGDTTRFWPNVLASSLMVSGWGYFLIQGVRDPLGGINSLWPLFGIANQMLAAIALCLATTVILKMELGQRTTPPERPPAPRRPQPALALVTLLPLVWLLSVTFTAGWQKIFHPDPRIGFLSQVSVLRQKEAGLRAAVDAPRTKADPAALAAAERAWTTNQTLQFNQRLDAIVAGTFLVLVSLIVALCIREWWRLLSRGKPAQMHEEPPVWSPVLAGGEGGGTRGWGWLALLLAFLHELTGQGEMRRLQKDAEACRCIEPDAHGTRCRVQVSLTGQAPATVVPPLTDQAAYVAMVERRYSKISRCC